MIEIYMNTSDLIPGHPAIWIKVHNRYGYVSYVPCIVEQVNNTRVQIKTQTKSGKMTFHWVDADNVTGNRIRKI